MGKNLKNVFLMRHGKSDWEDASLTDHDRPLSKRGVRDVPIMANDLNSKCQNIDLVLCSSSNRTKQTLDLAIPIFSNKPRVEILESLYLADTGVIWKTIFKFIIDYNNILLISHNPGLNNIVIDFNNDQYIKFPTSALAHLYSDKNTSNSYDQGDFKLLSISKPKDFL